jgi:protein-disulfide isomerase
MKKAFFAVVCLALASAASAKELSKEDLTKALEKHPEIILDFIKTHKKEVFEIVSQAAQEEQGRRQQEEAENEKKAFEESFKNPLVPSIDKKTRVRGNKEAKYTLVEYSDFQCPYCSRGYKNVEVLRKKYGKDLRFIYKHMPLPFHAMAMPSAQWLEAVAIQNPEKAWAFHDKLFENQEKLSEDFLKTTAKELGLDVKKAEADSKSDAVKAKIEADIEEAKKFGFQGTPGFLLNGIPVKGAYPPEFFDSIITKLSASTDAPKKAEQKN